MTSIVDPNLTDPETAPGALDFAGFALRAGALVWGWSLPAFPGTSSRG